MREVIETSAGPRAVGPYSQAVAGGGQLWISGQIGLDPRDGALVAGGVEAETRRALQNLQAILEAGGSELARVVKTTVYLVEMADFETVNRIYAEWFPAAPPARACVAVVRLPRGARIEIDAVALL